MNKIYLAIPYSWDPEAAFEIANSVTATLMEEGNVVFSPISHSHPIADYMGNDVRFDHDFWMAQDLPLVEWADEVHVVSIGDDGMELIENSRGVQQEIAHAKMLGKTVKIFEYHE